jgi:hypothetical protein
VKTCGKCSTEKDSDSFHRRKSSPDGLSATCKDCHKEYKKIYYQKNKDKLKAQMKEYSENNKEQIKVYLKEFYKDYYPKNRHKYIEQSRKRQQNLANSTPAWLTEEQKQQIKDTYWLAQDLKATTGEEYHVDHIVPLKGENVSGLHVPWNLQVLPADLNLRKSNNVNP